MDDFGGAFGVLLGVFGRSWGPLGRLVAVLEASWGCLGVLGNAKESLTMLACVREQDQDLRPQGHVTLITRRWGRGGRIQEGGETKKIRI